MADSNSHRRKSRLAESAYNSPYSKAGAPGPHPNADPCASLRATALSTLKPWATTRTPCVMKSYDRFLDEQEYEDIIYARRVVPVVRKYELDIGSQVKYPDSLITAFRWDLIEPNSQ
ncbi:hypothetical protein CC78DRAFT_620901 [Lojkania enalia]|uniref:Uncharacterized protein n=1 Tax=Lojkania enalia TaxID=147567 RepID=A0A9P4K094_9PLEO|nr:hypothetical protein CC78DRAFT_620901 [Didymosphaeria enalia]